jgi:hypothetical protein
MDVFNAGLGDDMIIINASNIAALEKTGAGNRARVDGGGVYFGSSPNFDKSMAPVSVLPKMT